MQQTKEPLVTMNTIKILDEKTINKIAAGEVVERPASVVKELCENAIDAGSTSISVEIKDGGISYIRVTDNGSGIEKDSIRTAFFRHATSKITSIDDLSSIVSLGFRGEALSSIAAVAQIELLTKQKQDVCGIRYRIEGGKELSFDEAGIPNGTTFLVRNLFFNTPARKKFLKSPLAEQGAVTELMEKLILSHPEIAFKYIINGKEKMASAGLSDIMQNTYSIFGREIAANLVPIDYHDGDFSITGFVGKPSIGRGNRNYELFFVNKRCVVSKVLSKACEEAYKPFLMLHRYPFVLLYINLPTDTLDVNVHPAKTEIRFLKENDVYNAVYNATYEGITTKELIPAVENNNKEEKLPTTVFENVKKVTSKPIDNSVLTTKSKVVQHIPEPFEEEKIEVYKETVKNEYQKSILEEPPVQQTLFSEGFLDAKERDKHKIIGQIFDTYWIVEYMDKMYIIDQHAAHEKIKYERLKKQIDNNAVISQQLFPSHIITLSESQIETLNQNMEVFNSLGFDLEPFGGREFSITAVPGELFGLSVNDYFISVLDDLSVNIKAKAPKEIADRIATMACKAAVKGNMHLSVNEADALIDELLSLDNPYNCPHGRPTIISYSKAEIEKLFKRIV